ncbi:MAG: peptidoglycan DD-metalloendopeptidase family protein [Dehalococcoidia bacterium]
MTPLPNHQRVWALWRLLPLLFVIGALALQRPAAAAGESVLTVISADGLNLRAAPSIEAPIVAVIPFDSILARVGDPTPDSWYPVLFGAIGGWANGAYLAAGLVSPTAATSAVPLASFFQPNPKALDSLAPVPAVSSDPSTLLMVFSPEGLALRASADSSSRLLTMMADNSLVHAGGPAGSNGWYPVLFDGRSGWADGAYLRAATAAVTRTGAALPPGTTVSLTPYGPVLLGLPAPFEAGSTAAVAPPGAAGRFLWPVAGRDVTTTFKAVHQAIDIGQGPLGGNPVVTITDGIVTFAGGDACCRYGLYVIVQHAGGFASLYAHLSRIDVNLGQIVHQAQSLGLSGNSGLSTGPHLHFAIYYQSLPFDPLTVLPGDAQIEADA